MARNQRNTDGNSLDQALWRWLGRIAFGTALVVIILTLTQCTIKKPEAPEWNTQFVVPAINRTYPMEELIRRIDQEGLEMDSLANVVYSITEDLDTFHLDASNLSTGNLSYSTSQTLGPIEIESPSVAPVQVSFDDIAGLAAGGGGVVPPASFSISNDMPPISNFSSATISSGTLYAVIDNNLGIDLDTVRVQLYDVGNSVSLGTQSIPGGLANGATDSLPFVLDGLTVSNNLRVNADCHNQAAVVLSTAAATITTSMHADGPLTVIAATAEVPAISRSFSQQVGLAETTPITNATFGNGQLQLTISNNTPLAAAIHIAFPDLTQSGQALTVTRQIAANSTANVVQNLAGYELAPIDQTVPQSINIDVTADAPATAPNQVNIQQSQNFSVSAALTNLNFSSVTGLFDAVEANIDPVQEDIDIPKGFDSVQLVHAALELEIHNKVELPGSIDLNVQGSNGKTLHLTGTVLPGSADGVVITTFSDTSVADFLSPIPAQISASGTASFGDGVSEGTIRANDFIFGRIKIIAPLELIINENHINTDVEDEKIEQDDIDMITDHVVEARFVYNITSRLPIGADFQIFLGGDSATLLTNPDKVIDGITVPAAPVVNSLAMDTVSTGYQTLILTSDDVNAILTNDTLYSMSVITLHDSNGQPVKLTASDYLRINARIEVEYHFDGNF